MQREVEIKTRELATLGSKPGVEALTQQRRVLIVQATVSDLLGKAVTALGDFRITRAQHLLEKRPAYDKSTVQLLTTARNYAEQAFELDPFNMRTKEVMAELLSLEASVLDDKGEQGTAAGKLRSAIDLQPNRAFYHSELASLLLRMGNVESALTESRTALRLDPNGEDYTSLVGMVLAFRGDVEEAVIVFRNMKLPSGQNEQYFRHYFAGIMLKTLLEVSEAPTMSKVREKLPKNKLKKAAINELGEYLRLAPNTAENQELIVLAKATILELEK